MEASATATATDERLERVARLAADVAANVGRVIVGKDSAIELVLVALLC